ncbi:hypothetical protein L596_012947 [Steinernema carpocapsae]|uniref:eIF-4F 25 kDa subunit n=1 Tax=Steinernema carpocapsae TaxID=34508 RepID=A0A4U5NYL0_STECR|nr:hypothetical protein L596_012947 [Steinernema carpocapsae]
MALHAARSMLVEDQVHAGRELHPLQNAYSIWMLKMDRNLKWEERLKEIVGFSTVEGFWSIHNYLRAPTKMDMGSDYYVFRRGIDPMWEDDNNAKGGRWVINVDKSKRADLLDKYWMELLMALIGEQFDDSEHICGVVVNCRAKGDKIAVWTRDAEKDDINLRIGERLRKLMELPEEEQITYVVHKAAALRSGSTVKPRLSIPRQRGSESSASSAQD